MTAKKSIDISKLSFEESLAELEGIVSELEGGQADLDKAMEVYTRGQLLKEHCSQKLASARLKVEQINSGIGGNPSLSAFNTET